MDDRQKRCYELDEAEKIFWATHDLRAVTATLCNPDGTSDEFPEMEKTVVDDAFIDYWRTWIRRRFDARRASRCRRTPRPCW